LIQSKQNTPDVRDPHAREKSVPEQSRSKHVTIAPKLNRNSSKPLYLQIYEELCDLLHTGAFKQGDRFPTELELVERYSVARITVRRAIAEMVQEGRLVRQAGKGTFVAAHKIERQLVDVSSFTERIRALGSQPSSQVIEVKTTPATARLARELEINIEAPVFTLVRLRFSDDAPVAIETSYLSLRRCPGLENHDLSQVSLYRVLREEYGLYPVSSEKTLELASAHPWEAQYLNIQTGAPLFLLRARVMNDSEPIEYVKILLRGDRFRFKI
jgi:GntR family transcriptional regulator